MWPGWVLLIHSRSEEEEGLHTASLILPPRGGASHIEVNYPTPCGGRVNPGTLSAGLSIFAGFSIFAVLSVFSGFCTNAHAKPTK